MASIPPCQNPDHPREFSRETSMVVIEEDSERVVFACKACRDINKALSVQVRTLPKGFAKANYQNEIRGVERQAVVRKLGKIAYFMPK